MTTTDLALLRRAVLLDPGSDDARLVFADAIEESGGEQEQRWAELIRCQVEMSAIPDPPPEPSVGMRSASRGQRLAALHVWSMQWKAKYYALRAREAALLRDLKPSQYAVVALPLSETGNCSPPPPLPSPRCPVQLCRWVARRPDRAASLRIPMPERSASKAWLKERGMSSMDDGDVP